MTRQEFINEVSSFEDLIDFCNDNNCYECDNVYYQDSFDDYINDCLSGWAIDDDWRDLRDRLADIPTGYDWYNINNFDGLDDDDFDVYKSDVLSWADDHDVWDESDDDDEVVDDDDDYEEPEDGCSFEELFAASSSTIQKVATEESDDDEAAAMIQMLMHS